MSRDVSSTAATLSRAVMEKARGRKEKGLGGDRQLREDGRERRREARMMIVDIPRNPMDSERELYLYSLAHARGNHIG